MLAGVMLAVIGVPMLAVTLVPVLARALGRSLGGERADSDLVAELDELRARVQQLEEHESRMAERCWSAWNSPSGCSPAPTAMPGFTAEEGRWIPIS